MAVVALNVRDRIAVTSYSPFRGLKGTIKQVHVISDPEDEELFCFYYVELDVLQGKSPMWFHSSEVVSVESAALPSFG